MKFGTPEEAGVCCGGSRVTLSEGRRRDSRLGGKESSGARVSEAAFAESWAASTG